MAMGQDQPKDPSQKFSSTMSPCVLSEGNPTMVLDDAATSLLNRNGSIPSSENICLEASTETTTIPEASKLLRRENVFLANTPSFPETLMNFIDDVSNSDVIAWMPKGDAFTIVNYKRFAKGKMLKDFNIRNLSSFVRKLYRYGFQRKYEKGTTNSDIFKHVLFRRGERKLCSKIKLLPNGSSGSAKPRTVPNKHGTARYDRSGHPNNALLPIQKSMALFGECSDTHAKGVVGIAKRLPKVSGTVSNLSDHLAKRLSRRRDEICSQNLWNSLVLRLAIEEQEQQLQQQQQQLWLIVQKRAPWYRAACLRLALDHQLRLERSVGEWGRPSETP